MSNLEKPSTVPQQITFAVDVGNAHFVHFEGACTMLHLAGLRQLGHDKHPLDVQVSPDMCQHEVHTNVINESKSVTKIDSHIQYTL